MGSETVVIGLNWVGDNILALPTYRALQHRFHGEGGITVAAPHNVASLLASSGVTRNVISWNGDTRERIHLLKRGGFRRAIILPNSFRAAAIAYAAGISERWGYRTDCRGFLLTHRIDRDAERGHQLDDYTALLNAVNAPRVVDEIPTIELPPPFARKPASASAPSASASIGRCSDFTPADFTGEPNIGATIDTANWPRDCAPTTTASSSSPARASATRRRRSHLLPTFR